MLGIMIINNYYVLHRGVYVEMTTGSSVLLALGIQLWSVTLYLTCTVYIAHARAALLLLPPHYIHVILFPPFLTVTT